MDKDLNALNQDFYNSSPDLFDSIPFEKILPDLIKKYGVGKEILEIGSGGGALAKWLNDQGYQVTCIEPALELAARVEAKGLRVHRTTIQNFESDITFDMVIAISSLIHVPKRDLFPQIGKIARLLKPPGLFFVSFIEGETEDFEDPTNSGRLRFFARWSEFELDELLSPYFTILENHRIYNKKMDRTFTLRVYTLSN